MKSITLAHSRITLREDLIVHIEYFDKNNFTIKESEEIFEATRQLCTPIFRCPLLITGGIQTNVDAEFRKHNASKEVLQHCSAVGVVVSSLSQILIVNFFIKFNKPASPTRFFKSEEKALEWLKNFEVVYEKEAIKQKSLKKTSSSLGA